MTKKTATLEEQLLDAAEKGDDGRIKWLLEQGVSPNASHHDYGEETPLHILAASEYDQTDMIQLLIDKGADVNVRNKAGHTPLHAAVMAGDVNTAELLVAKGADMDARDGGGKKPLDYAPDGVRHALQVQLQRAARTSERQPGIG